jgi:hypothetical protein
MPSGFGPIPSHTEGSSKNGGFNFPWDITHFPRGTSLGDNFSQLGGIPFFSTSGLVGFFPMTNFRNIFPVGSTFTPRGTPLRAYLVMGETMLLVVPPSK